MPDTSSAHSEAEQQLRIGSVAPEDQLPPHQQVLPGAVCSAVPPHLMAPLDQVSAVFKSKHDHCCECLLFCKATVAVLKVLSSMYGCCCRMWHRLHLMLTAQSSTARQAASQLQSRDRCSALLARPVS